MPNRRAEPSPGLPWNQPTLSNNLANIQAQQTSFPDVMSWLTKHAPAVAARQREHVVDDDGEDEVWVVQGEDEIPQLQACVEELEAELGASRTANEEMEVRSPVGQY